MSRTARSRRDIVEWIGGRIRLPHESGSSEPPKEFVAWLEEPSSIIVHARIRPAASDNVGAALREALHSPPHGVAAPPDVIRVADHELAAEVRRAVGGEIAVIVDPTPEIYDCLEWVIEGSLEKYDVDHDSPLGAALRAFVGDGRAEEPLGVEREAPPRSVGRNDPCPCGSGRKYKKCCLRKEAGAQESVHKRDAVHDRDERLVQDLVEYALDRFEPDDEGIARTFADPESAFPFIIPWSVYGHPVDGKRIVELYLEDQGKRLPRADREWLEAQRAAWLSVWKVTGVERGRYVGLEDLLSGEHRMVDEVSASESLTVGDAILARVVDHGGYSLLCGVYPQPLPPGSAAEVVRRARGRLRCKSQVPLERLRDGEFGGYLIRRWEEAVMDLMSRPRELRNTDDELIILTTDLFDIAPGATAAVEDALAGLPLAQAPEPDHEEHEFIFVRPGNAVHRSWETTLLGRASVREDTLVVEANSRERADGLREDIEQACGDLIHHRRRDERRPGDEPPGPPGPARAEPPEVRQLALHFKAQHYAGWPDEPLPALDGRTPREAAQTGQGRRRLDLLLEEMQHTENRMAGDAAFDFGEIRRALGLEQQT